MGHLGVGRSSQPTSRGQGAFPVFADPKRAAREARTLAVSVNRYLSKTVKYVLNHEQTSFDGGSAKGDREDEKVIPRRLQIAFK